MHHPPLDLSLAVKQVTLFQSCLCLLEFVYTPVETENRKCTTVGTVDSNCGNEWFPVKEILRLCNSDFIQSVSEEGQSVFVYSSFAWINAYYLKTLCQLCVRSCQKI